MRSKARLEQEINKVKEGLTAEQEARFDRAIELARKAMEEDQWLDELDGEELANLADEDAWLSEAERDELCALMEEFGDDVVERCVDPDTGPFDPEKPLIPEPLRKYYWSIDRRIHRLGYWNSYSETTEEEKIELEALEKQRNSIYNMYSFPQYYYRYYAKIRKNDLRLDIPPEKREYYENIIKEICYLSEKMMNKTATIDELESLFNKYDEKSELINRYTKSEDGSHRNQFDLHGSPVLSATTISPGF